MADNVTDIQNTHFFNVIWLPVTLFIPHIVKWNAKSTKMKL